MKVLIRQVALLQNEQEQPSSVRKDEKQTPYFLRMPLGSQVAIQPSRQPGTIHLFDIDPRERTGTMDPNSPIGTYGLLPNAIWP